MHIKTALLSCVVGVSAIGATVYFCESDSTYLQKSGNSSSGSGSTKYVEKNRMNKDSFIRVAVSSDKNAAQLIGPDANGNLIRDDIDEYIENTYPDPRQRSAMIQFAAAYGRLLLEGGTAAGAKQAGDQVVRSIQCGIEVFGDSNIVKQKTILAMILNTEDRFSAYATAAHNEEGQVFPRFQGEPCLKN